MTFDKTKVVPPEYARVLDSNIKFHFLDESGTVLHTIDDSDFNIIISNTQKSSSRKNVRKPLRERYCLAATVLCCPLFMVVTILKMMLGMMPL